MMIRVGDWSTLRGPARPHADHVAEAQVGVGARVPEEPRRCPRGCLGAELMPPRRVGDERAEGPGERLGPASQREARRRGALNTITN